MSKQSPAVRDWTIVAFGKTTFEEFAQAQLVDFPEEVREQVRVTLVAAMQLAYDRGVMETLEDEINDH